MMIKSLSVRILFLIVMLLNEHKPSTSSVIRYKRADSIRTQVDQSVILVSDGESFKLTCTSYTYDKNIDIRWMNPTQYDIQSNGRITIENRIVSENPLTMESTLTIDRVGDEDYGLYQCVGYNEKSLDPVQFTVAKPSTYEPVRSCGIYEATCRNGQCISKSGLCDGITDCSDGSDELSCSINRIPGKCEPNEKACRNGHCLQKIWYCDGEPDCDDKSDELECSSLPTNGICKGHEFECKSRNQCVLKSFICDKENDCQDFSDEMGCEPPRILEYPVRNITVVVGGSFTIQCKAAGFPAPYINWRLNWGHTCEENEKERCYSTNTNGYGVFTATDVKFNDAGAYSCEAINSMGRIFAIPDTIVTVTPGQRPITTRRPTTTKTTTITPPIEPMRLDFESDCPMCHNHTDECTCSGYCLNCKHNTEGIDCGTCKPGYTGDAKRGTPYDCIPLNQPFIIPTYTSTRPTTRRTIPTTIGYEIEVEDDCECFGRAVACTCSGICINCTQNTRGDKCNECKSDFYAFGEGWNLRCEPKKSNLKQNMQQTKSRECNPYGTLHETEFGCKCKSGVTGQYCDECKPRYFSFINENSNYKKGCLSCFCNGLSVECKSSDSYYRKKISYFENEDWYISNKYTQLKENVQFIQNGILFDKIKSFNSDDLYFIVSSQFKGNHLVSYNGELSFKFKYELLNYKNNNNNQKLEIRISGNNINLIHVFDQELVPNVENQISVKLNENSFKRYGDNGSVEREFFLMALADIELIMIKAKLSNDQTTASLSDFSIEYADSKDSSLRQATSVEICNCPVEYTGTSCESCASGYKRSSTGFYWGVCESD